MYVIVGGGSAGCVLAAWLSEDPATTVCLLEAGGGGNSLLLRLPVGAVAMVPGIGRINNRAFRTVPQKGLNGRRGYRPRGRAPSGSSAVNAMLYPRGHRSDYDDRAASGCPGRGWDAVLPYFLKSGNNERGADEFHNDSGPLHVSDRKGPRPVTAAFIEAAMRLQHQRPHDNDRRNGRGADPWRTTTCIKRRKQWQEA